MSDDDVARRVAARYPTRFLRSYVRAKIARDPVYNAVFEQVHGCHEPLLDVGCGVGVLEIFLRERGVGVPMVGLDSDETKVAIARRIAPEAATFSVGDALVLPPFHGTVVMLDLLHYLTVDEQQRMLLQAIDRSSGLVIVRDAVNDHSLRYRMTVVEETFARAVGWLRVPRLQFPAVEQIVTPFHDRGFEAAVSPMWGRTPYNNYLFVFNRP